MNTENLIRKYSQKQLQWLNGGAHGGAQFVDQFRDNDIAFEKLPIINRDWNHIAHWIEIKL